MKNTPIVILAVFLSLILIGLGIFVFLSTTAKKATSTTPTPNNNTPTPPVPTVSDAELLPIAQDFRAAFVSYLPSQRCSSFAQLNLLSMADLARVDTMYKANYGLSIKEEMDGAYEWCWYSSNDSEVYEKLKMI
jgi:hypothetical protein